MVKKTVISKGLFLVLGVILSTFVLCTNGERDNILDSGSPKHSKPISITVKANKDTVFINDTVILKIDCVNESILDYFIWKTGKEEDETVEDFISYTWKNEGLKIISVYAVDKLTRVSEVVFCTVFVELGKPIVELESDTITTYINDTVECVAHATDNGIIKKYNWATTIKNIEMSDDSIQKIVSKDTGLFFVILSVEDDDSVSSLADTCIVIIKEGKPKAQIVYDKSTIEIRDTVTISVDTSDEYGVIEKFIWEYTSKNRDSTVHDTTKPGSRDFVWNDTGFVTISVIAVDDDGLFSETSRCTIYVDIGPKPTVLLDSNIVNSYINDSTTITATGSDENGTVTGFLWKEAETGKTYSTVDGQFSFVWREAGTRKITVQAVDNDGQLSDYDTCVIYIDSGIPVAIAHPNTIGSTTRQDGITVTLEAKDNNLEGELVWFWDTGSPGWDDSTSGPTRTFTSSNGGVITIIWAVRDNDNLFSKKDTFQISFNSPPCSTEIIEPKEVAQWNSFNKNSGTGSVKCIWTFDDPDSASDIKRYKLLIRNDDGATIYTFQRYDSFSTLDTILTFGTLSKYTWNMVVYDNFGDSAQSSGSFTTSFGSPVISEDPIGSTVFKGDTVTFSVIAEGNGLFYQWYMGTYAIPSANKAQYSLNSVDYADSIHKYYCIVSNTTGSDTSETVSIRVLPKKPVIDSINYDKTVTQREDAVFTVFASGEFLEYQWQKNGADILVDGSVLTIDSVNLADNGSQFRCIVSNAGGSDTSEVMTLEVALAPPVIINEPDSIKIAIGNYAKFGIKVLGDSLSYQWQKNEINQTGKTEDSILINPVMLADSGMYRCVVSNSAGTDTSISVQVTVCRVYFKNDSIIFKDSLDYDNDEYYSMFNVNYEPYVSNNGSANIKVQLNYKINSETSYSTFWNPTDLVEIKGTVIESYHKSVPFNSHSHGEYDYQLILICENTPVDTIYGLGHKEELASEDEIAPKITKQPINVTKKEGENAIFIVTSTGSNLQYKWQKNGSDIFGVKLSYYIISSVSSMDEATYRCIVSNSAGSVTSNSVTLTIIVPPTITNHPSSIIRNEGDSATLNVSAVGTDLHYQWQKNGIDMPGQNLDKLKILSTQPSDSGYYRCIVYNSAGSDTSYSALLNLICLPVIVENPSDSFLYVGDNMGLSVKANGKDLDYEWFKNGESLNITTPSYFKSSACLSDNGEYFCIVSNDAGSVSSDTVVLSVHANHSDILFFDDFTSNVNYWGTNENNYSEQWIDSSGRGYYYWDFDSTGLMSRQTNSTGSFSAIGNYSIEMDIEYISGGTSFPFGLVFCTSSDDFYRFGIAGNKMYLFDQNYNDEWNTIKEWTSNSSINSQSPNLLKITMVGETGYFYINGKWVYTTIISPCYGDRFGFSVEQTMQIRVDYIKIAR